MQHDVPKPKLAYSIREVCEATSLSRTTVYSHISSGRLKVIRIGGRVIVPAENLLKLINGEG